MKGMYWLMVIIAVAWILILFESYIFFAVIRPLGPPLRSGPIPSTLLKIAGTVALAGVWLIVTLSLRLFYLRSKEAKSPS